MRKLTIAYLFFAALNLRAQNPEPILSFATELKPVSWYQEQAKLWKKEIDKNNQNSRAWYNYYRANRNKMRLDTTDKRLNELKVAELRKIIEDMGVAVPNSFDYNLSKWMYEGNNMDYIQYLKKAEELGEDRIEHYSDMLGWGEVTRDISKRDKYAKKWLENAPYSPGLMYYNYNVMAGLKPNAILITTGDNDTYPCWLLQAQGIRRDVTVVNASLVYIDSYRDALFKELGIPPLKSMNDLNKDSLKNKAAWYQKELVKYMARNAHQYPIYLALTCSEEYSKNVADSLYLTGLAYEYATVDPGNIALLRKNFEQVYAMDYLDKAFYKDISTYYAQHSNFNYIVPMMQLYDHYQLSNDKVHATWIKTKILTIAKGRKEEKDILNYLNSDKKGDR